MGYHGGDGNRSDGYTKRIRDAIYAKYRARGITDEDTLWRIYCKVTR